MQVTVETMKQFGLFFAVVCISIASAQRSDSTASTSYSQQRGHNKYGDNYRSGQTYRSRYRPLRIQYGDDSDNYDGYDSEYYDYECKLLSGIKVLDMVNLQ